MSDRLEKIKRQMEPCDVCKRNRFTAPEWLDDTDVVWLIGEVARTENQTTKLKELVEEAYEIFPRFLCDYCKGCEAGHSWVKKYQAFKGEK